MRNEFITNDELGFESRMQLRIACVDSQTKSYQDTVHEICEIWDLPEAFAEGIIELSLTQMAVFTLKTVNEVLDEMGYFKKSKRK